jgi:hypothetical protein
MNTSKLNKESNIGRETGKGTGKGNRRNTKKNMNLKINDLMENDVSFFEENDNNLYDLIKYQDFNEIKFDNNYNNEIILDKSNLSINKLSILKKAKLSKINDKYSENNYDKNSNLNSNLNSISNSHINIKSQSGYNNINFNINNPASASPIQIFKRNKLENIYSN